MPRLYSAEAKNGPVGDSEPICPAKGGKRVTLLRY